MAHVNAHQAHDSGIFRAALDAYSRRRNLERELKVKKEINASQVGASLQNTRSKLDTDLEIAKLNNKTQELLAKYKSGVDLQLKQMGIDLDLELQKLRNMNAIEKTELEGKLARMLEKMKDQHYQSQILKQYQANLKLAKYNSRQALLRTFMDTMGDIYKTGNPLDNAADAAAFGIWSLAFKLAYGNEMIEATSDEDIGSLDKQVKVDDSTGGMTDESIEKLIKTLKGADSEHVAPGSKISRYKEPGFRTKVKLAEKKRAGTKSWEKR